MINLIRNELTKIFHKKAIYVVLILTIAFMILNCVMIKIFENQDYYETDTDFYEEQLSYLDKSNPEDREQYIMLETELKVAELAQKYDINSWQRYIVNRDGYEIIQNLLLNEDKEEHKKYENQYEELVYKLDNDDWRYFVQQELDETNDSIKLLEESSEKNSTELESLKDKKQALEWRLEKGISYGDSNLNSLIEQWTYGKQEIRNYEESAKTQIPTYKEKYQNQGTVELVNICEYAITKGISDNFQDSYINNRYNICTSADSELIDVFSFYTLFITIAIVIIAGTIISEEFNKGTIKLLLVKPYKRIKILVAKFIACLIVLALTYVVVALLQTIIGGFTYGFNDYSNQIIIYNFKTNAVETIGLFKYLVISGLSILPQYILIMTLAFTLSVLFNNSPIAVALPLVGMMGAEIINELAYQFEKAKFLMYFVTPNWDLSIYLFGKLPQFEPISLPFSIIICLIYFAIMAIVSIVVFKKREIKNI